MTAVEPQALPHTLAAPGLARRHLRSLAGAWPAELFDLVVLLTGELVTNAVVHGRAPVHLLLIDDGNRLRVEVSDGGGGSLPRTPRRPADVDASGRGLLIIDRVADRWGHRPHRTRPGKTVWFELRRSVKG